MGLRVKFNHCRAVARAIPREVDEGVKEVADAMTLELKGTLWVDTGVIRDVTREISPRKFHAEVWIGYYLGRGFYSGFQEFGTRKQAARPIVTPTAHAYEPQYVKEMAERLRRACDAK